jgi:hypothetical protein
LHKHCRLLAIWVDCGVWLIKLGELRSCCMCLRSFFDESQFLCNLYRARRTTNIVRVRQVIDMIAESDEKVEKELAALNHLVLHGA